MLDYLILFIAVEGLVELWKKAAPLQDFKERLISETPFLYSSRLDTHMMECPYCMSFWIGLFCVLIYLLFQSSIYIFMIIAVHRMSNHFHLIFSLLRDKQLDRRANRRTIYG